MSNPNGGKILTELSIEETNKIRLSLGLKPLRIDPPKLARPPPPPPQQSNKEEKNENEIAKSKEQEEIENTLKELKKKRESKKPKSIAEQLLEDGENDDDDLTSWIQRSRNIEKQKQEDDKVKPKQAKKAPAKSKTPSSIRIGNDISAFTDGRERILILEDANVLDEDHEDTFIDVQITEKENREKLSKDNRKQSKLDKFDEYGGPNEILSQYDERKTRKSGFTITNEITEDDEMTSNITVEEDKDSVERHRELIKSKLAEYSSYDLDISKPTSSFYSSAFYTPEEMEKMKKPSKKPAASKKAAATKKKSKDTEEDDKKKKKKLRKKDDLTILEELDETKIGDRGSRESRANAMRGDQVHLEVQKANRETNYQKALEKAAAESKLTYSSDVFEESEDIEFYKSLSTTKKAPILVEKEKSIAELVNKSKMKSEKKDEEEYETDESLKTNDYTEFVKNLKPEGILKSLKPNVTKEKSNDDHQMEIEETEVEVKKISEEVDTKMNEREEGEEEEEEEGEERERVEKNSLGDTTSVMDIINNKPTNSKKRPLLGEEPLVSSGLGATLALLSSKGELKTAPSSSNKKRKDINYEDEDTVIHMEDDHGEKLTKADMFVHQSQIFHGKKSGKNKIDKKIRKHEKDMMNRHMSTSESNVGLVQAFQNYQKATNLPYLVLSGGGKDNPALQNLEKKK